MFDIWYRPRSLVKGKVLADYVVEFTPLERGLGVVCNMVAEPWKVFVDGASNAWGMGIGIITVSPKGVKLEHSLRLSFWASNNEVKYKALLAGLKPHIA